MKNILTLLLLFTSTYLLIAQDASWINYTEPERVGGLLETPNTIWLSTNGGLIEIEKDNWSTNYWTKANAGLSSNDIEDIAVHPSSQNIYIGTYDVALMVRENGSNDWEKLPYPSSITDEVGAMIRTYCLEFDDQGILWIGTDKGLIRYDGENWDLMGPSDHHFLGGVWGLEYAENGKLYISSHGFFELDGETLTMLSPEGSLGEEPLFAYGYSAFYRNENGHMWFFTDLGTVGHYDGEEWVSIEQLPGFGFSGIGHFSVGLNSDGILEAMEKGKDPYHLTEDGWVQADSWYTSTPLIRQFFLEDGTRLGVTNQSLVLENGEEYIYTNYPFRRTPFRFRYDQDGHLWMLDSNNIILNPATWETFVAEEGITSPVGFNDYAFAKDGSFWCTTGRAVHHYVDGQWLKYDYTNSVLPDVYGFNSIQPLENGEVWLYIYDEGIYHFEDGAWTEQSHPAFSFYNVYKIQAVPNGVWVYMNTPDYEPVLAFWDGADLDIIQDFENGYSNENIVAFTYDDASDRLWVMSYEGNVQYLENGLWNSFELPLEADGIEYIRNLILQGDQMIFYTSYGVYIYRHEEWQSLNVTNSPMSNGVISEAGLDGDGYLWITHGNNANSKVVDRYDLGLLSSDETLVKYKNLDIEVLENPVREGLLKISFPMEELSKAQIMITDAAGKKHSFKLITYTNERAMLDISNLSAGWYTVSIQTEGSIYSQSFVK